MLAFGSGLAAFEFGARYDVQMFFQVFGSNRFGKWPGIGRFLCLSGAGSEQRQE